jgi:ATP-dependent helicase/nuclease subunit A
MFQELTFEQFCALDYDRNIVVSAGPGAGKTRILSYRFCFILLTADSVTIPQILTLTFTEKAAEEMKSRIYQILTQISGYLKLNGNEAVKNLVIQAIEDFHKNRISTIHSFCANLLREHPIESRVDPGFKIIQGARQQKVMEQALEKGISNAWQENKERLIPLLQSFGNHNGLLNAVRTVIQHPLTFKRVQETSQRLFNIKRWDRKVFKEYCNYIKDEILIPYLMGLRKSNSHSGQYEELLSKLETWYENRNEDSDDFGLSSLFKGMRELASLREASSSRLSVTEGLKTFSYVDLIDEFFPDLFLLSPPDIIFGDQLNTFLGLAKTCLCEYRKKKALLNSLDFADLEERSNTFLSKLLKSDSRHELRKIQKQFRYIMVDEFQDTNRDQWEIISALCNEEFKKGSPCLKPGKLFVVGDKRQAIYKFRGGDVTVFETVINEIKESNPRVPKRMFWEKSKIVETLAGNKILDSITFKQYQHSFDSLPDNEKKEILKGDIYLPHNFRACSHPIDFINRIFNEIFSNRQAGNQREYETTPRKIVMPNKKTDRLKGEGSVTIYLSRSRGRSMGKAESSAILVTEIIESILGVHGKDRFEYKEYPDIRKKIEGKQLAIGILFFSFNNIKIFENILREASLPFSIHKGKGFFRCSEVMDIVQLLNYINDDREQISLLSVLRSPIFGVSDPEIFDLFYKNNVVPDTLMSSENSHVNQIGKQIRSWRLQSNSMTLTELIRKIISDRQLTAIHSTHVNGLQRLANLEKFTEIARRFQEEGSGSLHEFVEYCIEMAEQDEEEGEALIISDNGSPINLMTIHASKGLEFPMVIIPDLERKIPNRPKNGKPVRLYSDKKTVNGSWNLIEGEIPVWPVEVPSIGYAKKYSPLGYLLMERNSLEDMAENRRVFYVGCTRAEDHLILAGQIKSSLISKKKTELTSNDYRKRASIMDMLNDIYQFPMNYLPDQTEPRKNKNEKLSVIWKDPKPREYRGYVFGKEKVLSEDFGEYNNGIIDADLTDSIILPSYLQLSFHSIHLYRKCPLRFFYTVILGIRVDDAASHQIEVYEALKQDHDPEENHYTEYMSGEALLLGSLIHGYLEKHHFGNRFEEDLLTTLWQRHCQTGHENNGLSKEVFEKIRKKAYCHLKNTVNDDRLIRLLGGKKDLVEVPFLFTISQGCEFRGVIDRLFRDDRGCWTIIDWKSNDLSTKEPHEVAQENDYHLQLACYKWAVEYMTGERVENLFIYFTDKGMLVKSFWDGKPAQIVNEILKKTRENGADREKWIRDLKKCEATSIDCYNCGYKDFFCNC